MAISDEIPKSRLTLTYRTSVSGSPEDVQLPFRVVVMGDLSGGSSKDRKTEIDRRALRRLDGKNLNAVMADMDMSVEMTVPNRIDPERGAELKVKLPVKSMKSFTPAEVGASVPKVRALLLLKKLLLEVQANLDNRKEFRRLLRQLAQDKGAVESMLKELQGFADFKLPSGPGSKAEGGADAKGKA